MAYNTEDYESILNDIEMEREKYRIIAELADCGVWEYNIETKELCQSRKLSGRYSNSNLNIPDYRTSVLNWGLIYPEDLPIFNQYCDSLDHGDNYFHYEFRALGDGDDYIWMKFEGSGIKDKNGKSIKVIGMTTNVDNEKKDREILIQRTERDSLTKLYNQVTTKDKVEKCIERYKEYFEKHCFMIIDIDNFKEVNDRFGHLYGDIVLETFASHLSALFESTDVIGRIGGDEFVVFHKGVQEFSNIQKSAQSICNMVRSSLTELKVESKLSVSIGLSVFPTNGTTYDELFKKADIALYEVKSMGKDNYCMFDPMMEHIQSSVEIEQKITKKSEYIVSEYTSDAEKRLLNFTYDTISETNDVETAINKIFTEVGKYYNLSRITIFERELPNQNARVSYEWLNSGISSCKDFSILKTQIVSKYFVQLFEQNRIYTCEDVTKISVVPMLRDLYCQLGTRALLQYAVFDSNKLIGSVNFEDCNESRIWSKFEIDALSSLTRILTNYILQLRSKEELKNEIFFTQAMLNNQKLSNYAIKQKTYELIYINEYTENKYPSVKLGELCYKALFGRNIPCEPCPITGLTGKYTRYSVEAYNENMDAWYSSTASAVDMPNGQKINFICSSDVTGFVERVKAIDTLTGLLTLPKFEAEAMKLIANTKNALYAIMYLDFNKFKYINDEWGYSVGNEILKFFAERVSRLLSSTELFSRISGDIFVILLSYSNNSELLYRIKTIANSVIHDYNQQFPGVNPTIIGGIYFLTPEDKVLSVAMDKANIARKKIKGFHKSNYAIYDDNLHQEITKEKMIENQMQEALKNNEFVVYMQPKVDLRSLVINGAEALVRWKTSTGKMMNPVEFIPIFEKNGFIVELDFYVYEKAFITLRQWIDMGKQPITMSINVSRLHIEDAYFVQKLDRLVDKYNLPTELIELEITESIFLNGLDRLLDTLNCLRKKGFLISIDDFGSGYSSLNLLKTLPIDIIKIDKEFFMKNTMGDKDRIVITSIIQLAKGLGLKVICEGVETLEQARFLRESYCDMVQGYFFYQPMESEKFTKLID